MRFHGGSGRTVNPVVVVRVLPPLIRGTIDILPNVFIPLSKSGQFNCTFAGCCFASEISAVCGAVCGISNNHPKNRQET